MMPAHYALSDAAIVMVAAWAALPLWRQGKILPAFAMACLGIAAAIGVVRFGAGLQAELAALHAGGSQMLGPAALLALSAHILRRKSDRNDGAFAVAILAISAGIFFLAKALLAPLFLLALTVGLCAAIWHAYRFGLSWLVPSGLMILLANTLLIRRSPWLTEAAAWHIYHMLIALALILLARAMHATPLDVREKGAYRAPHKNR